MARFTASPGAKVSLSLLTMLADVVTSASLHSTRRRTSNALEPPRMIAGSVVEWLLSRMLYLRPAGAMC